MRARKALTLTEALVASLIFTAVVVPTISLMSTSQRQIAKVQDHMLAVNLAMSVIEEMRARRPQDRASFSATRPDALPQLAPLVTAHRTRVPASEPEVTRTLDAFRCAATVTPAVPGNPGRVNAVVTWTEAGEPQSVALDAQLDLP